MVSSLLNIDEETGSFKEKQKMSYEGAQVNYDGCEHHDYFRELPFIRVKKLLEKANININNAYLHIASCGSGIDIYYLSKFYNAKILASDYSNEAIERVRKTFAGIEVKVEDNEKLSFNDNYFDWSFIAASLHHLPRPIVGLYELLRVSKQGIIVIEPYDSLLTRIAVSLGMAQKYEASGNYVYRFSRGEIYKISRSGYCDYFIDRCFAPHRVAKKHLGFVFLKWLTIFFNATISPLGNYVIFIIKKRPNSII